MAQKYAKSVNQGVVKVLSRVDLQDKCQFEVTLTSQGLSGEGIAGKALAIAGDVVDTIAVKFFLQSITIPGQGIEIGQVNGMKHATNAIYPETCTLTFLEDSYGLVRRWLIYWLQQVSVPYAWRGPQNRLIRGRVFMDDQEGAKKNARVKMLGPNGLPLQPTIRLKGLLPKSIAEDTVSHDSKEIVTFALECSVDVVELPLFGLLG